MDVFIPTSPISPLRQRLIDDMTMREFSRATQNNYIRDVGRLATFLGRRPDTATTEDVRRFQVEQREAGVPLPTMTLAFEHAFRLGERRVSAEVVEQVLSRVIDDLEPTLTRNGYDAPALIVLLHAKPAEARDFLAGTLAGDRAREFTEKLRVAGVPI